MYFFIASKKLFLCTPTFPANPVLAALDLTVVSLKKSTASLMFGAAACSKIPFQSGRIEGHFLKRPENQNSQLGV